ncbi:MAG: glycosyltransferase family 2 protein [Candidatus Helarchaeota archaeon]|nr:glycosyltransferase family 2 protein [Candidatus Helarchaeota archaeon]
MSKVRYLLYSILVIALFAIYHIFFPREYSYLLSVVDYVFNNLNHNLLNNSLYSMFYRNLNPLDILGIFLYLGLLVLFIFYPLLFGIFFFAGFGGYKKYDKSYEPTLSVIIPSLNEADGLKRTIDTILTSEYPKEKIEILAIISGSTDNSEEICKQYINQNQPVRILNNTLNKKGKPPALNYGVSEAKNEILVFYDSGAKLLPDTLHNLVAPLQNKKNKAVVGPLKVENWNKNTLTRGTALENATYNGPGLVHEILQRLGRTIWLFGRNWAIFKKDLEEIGKFDEDALTEDLLVSVQLAVKNKKIVFVPNAVIYSKEPEKFQNFKKQRTRWLFGYRKDAGKLMQTSTKALRTVITRNFVMLHYAHFPLFTVGAIIFTLIFIFIQDYYLVLVGLTMFIFTFGHIVNAVRKYGDKHYSNLLYLPWHFRNVGYMFTSQFRLPETLEWEKTSE